MKAQTEFTGRRPDSSIETNQLWMRVTKIPNLEYAVLMAHVFIYEDLCWLLGVRLRTDTLPERRDLPPFAKLVDIVLAGSEFESDRETLQFLNSARNEIAHDTDRLKFDGSVQNFCSRLWSDKTYGTEGFKWQRDETKQVKALWYAVGVLSARFGDFFDQFAERKP
jgi:hypothetical protein